MDPNACGETAVQIYTVVENRLTAAGYDAMMEANKIEVFREAMKLYMTNLINEKGKGGSPQQGQQQIHHPSQKQIDYAEDLGCKNADTMDSKTLSKWIDEHK